MLRRIGFALCLITLFIVPLGAQVVTSPEVVRPNQIVTVPDLALITAADGSKAAVAKAALAIVFSSAKMNCDPASHLNVVLDAYAEQPLQIYWLKNSPALRALKTANRNPLQQRSRQIEQFWQIT